MQNQIEHIKSQIAANKAQIETIKSKPTMTDFNKSELIQMLEQEISDWEYEIKLLNEEERAD